MDHDRFSSSPVGRLVPLRGIDGRTGVEYDHLAFSPDALQEPPELSGSTWTAVTRASRALGRLSQAARQVPSPDLFRRPTLTREAQSTSALEGTFAPIAEVLASEAEDEGTKARPPIREILNYISAAELAFAHIDDHRSISVGLLEHLHRELITGTGSESVDTGRIRTVPVVIGAPGSAIKDARFIPPPPGIDLQAAIQDLVNWINEDDHERDPLVGAAMAHYQFETLHPFNDGNGRIGRLLVVVQLVADGTLSEPLLSISPWFESRRAEYMDCLAEVSATGDWDSWTRFFARGLEASADDTARRVNQLLDLQAQFRERIRAGGARGVILDVADNLIGRPYVRVPPEAKRTHKTAQAIYNVVERLEQLNILVEVSGRSYDRMWFAPQVVEIITTPPAW